MKQIVKEERLIAACGLYCGACPQYLSDKCPGCKDNVKATWCKIRTCCSEKKIDNCAGCGDFSDVKNCKTFHNRVTSFFSFIFRSNREASIQHLRTLGGAAFVEDMVSKKRMTLPR